VSAITRAVTCERVRAQVSLELDSELSQLERRMLEAHLARCADCARFAEGVGEVTRLLRSAPLETPSRPVIVRAPRRLSLARLQVAAAAALVLATLGAAAQLDFGSLSGAPTVSGVEVRYTQQLPTRVDVESELAIIELFGDRATTYSGARLL